MAVRPVLCGTIAAVIADEIRSQGFSLVRGALPRERVERYRDALDSIYAREGSTGDILPKRFASETGMRLTGLFLTGQLARAALELLGVFYPVLSTFMSVRKDLNGVPLHTDGIIQGTREYVLCFWAPLHPCGKDAPGLSVIPASRARVTRYLQSKFHDRQIPGWHSTEAWNSYGAFEPAALRDLGDPFSPEMQPGDVMAFTNWTIHGSNITPSMSKLRSAAILRLRQITPAVAVRVVGSKLGRALHPAG